MKKNNIRICPAFLREKVRKICNCPRPHSSFVTEMRTDEFIKRILILKDNLFRVVFQITGDHNLSEEMCRTLLKIHYSIYSYPDYFIYIR